MTKSQKNSTITDPYGNKGAIPDASWTEQWMRFSPAMRNDYLASVAHWGPLGIVQLECLIQGLLPPPHTWLSTCTCMAEYEPLIKRLRQDIQREVLADAPTADEFAAWCDQMGVTLPDPLVQEIRKIALTPLLRSATPHSTQVIVVPAWAPIVIKNVDPPSGKKPKGRPSTGAAKYEVLVRDAHAMLMGAAQAGRKMTIPEIAEKLQRTPCGEGMEIDSIVRRLKGKLPVTQARATATRYQLA